MPENPYIFEAEEIGDKELVSSIEILEQRSTAQAMAESLKTEVKIMTAKLNLTKHVPHPNPMLRWMI